MLLVQGACQVAGLIKGHESKEAKGLTQASALRVLSSSAPEEGMALFKALCLEGMATPAHLAEALRRQGGDARAVSLFFESVKRTGLLGVRSRWLRWVPLALALRQSSWIRNWRSCPCPDTATACREQATEANARCKQV